MKNTPIEQDHAHSEHAGVPGDEVQRKSPTREELHRQGKK